MKQAQIIALRCPSCGRAITEASRETGLGIEVRCDGCGMVSALIVDRDNDPRESWRDEAMELLASGNDAAAIRVVHKANTGMGLYEAKVVVDSLKAEAADS